MPSTRYWCWLDSQFKSQKPGRSNIDQNLEIMRNPKYNWVILFEESTFVLAFHTKEKNFLLFWDPDATD